MHKNKFNKFKKRKFFNHNDEQVLAIEKEKINEARRVLFAHRGSTFSTHANSFHGFVLKDPQNDGEFQGRSDFRRAKRRIQNAVKNCGSPY